MSIKYKQKAILVVILIKYNVLFVFFFFILEPTEQAKLVKKQNFS